MDADDYPGASPWVPDRPSLGALEDALPDCRGCDLYQDATQVVPGAGRAGSSLLLLGEQPGDKEDQAGEPFVGPAGRLLDEALAAAGIDPEDAFVTNAVKHFRWEGHRGSNRLHKSPARWQLTACGPWLVAELDAVRPTGVVLLGATAGKAVFGSSFRVSHVRGELQRWPDAFAVHHRPEWVLPTQHPSAVLRAPKRETAFDALVADLRVAATALH